MKRRKSSSSSLPPRQRRSSAAPAGRRGSGSGKGSAGAAANAEAHYAVRLLSPGEAARLSSSDKADSAAAAGLVFCLYQRDAAGESAPLGYCFIRSAAAFGHGGAAEPALPAAARLRFCRADIAPRARNLLLRAVADYCRRREQDLAAYAARVLAPQFSWPPAAAAEKGGATAAAKPLYYKLRPQNPPARAFYPPEGGRRRQTINLQLLMPPRQLIELPAGRKP